MMGKRLLLMLFAGCCCCLQALAQSDDEFGMRLGVDASKKLVKGLNVNAGVELGSQDGFKFDRFKGGVGLGYRVAPYLKLDGGYEYIRKHNITGKESTYNMDLHRLAVSATGIAKLGRLEFSLRERYQYTMRPEQTVTKTTVSGSTSDVTLSSKNKSVLRSRVKVQWDIKHSRFAPYAYYECFSNISNNWNTDKNRFSLGTDYKFNKKNSISVYYMYQNKPDDDEANGHIIGADYKVKF